GWFRPLQAGSDEAGAGLDVDVERGCVHVAPAPVVQADAQPGLVRFTAAMETGGALDAEERGDDLRGVGDEVCTDSQQRPGQGAHQPQRRLTRGLLVAFLVGKEPLAVVVARQFAQEAEYGRVEPGLGHASYGARRPTACQTVPRTRPASAAVGCP